MNIGLLERESIIWETNFHQVELMVYRWHMTIHFSTRDSTRRNVSKHIFQSLSTRHLQLKTDAGLTSFEGIVYEGFSILKAKFD